VQQPIPVAILASDQVTGDGAAAYLRSRRELRLVDASCRDADVLLVLVRDVTDEWIAKMERAAAEAAGDLRIVLVADEIKQGQLLRAIHFGLVSVLPRSETGYDRILRVVTGSRQGLAEMHDRALGMLIEQVRMIQQDVLVARGLTPEGLETREVEVLKRLADGLDTVEIAHQMNYSERTIKNVIHGMITRLNLRNRSHLVAYGLRCGAL